MSANSELVTAFIESWKGKDVDRIVDFFTEDAVYINIPIDPPNHGKEAIRAMLASFLGMAEEIEFVIHHQGETPDGLVMNERTDRFRINGQWAELPVMGIFELTDGKISAWRDYFDRGQMADLSGQPG